MIFIHEYLLGWFWSIRNIKCSWTNENVQGRAQTGKITCVQCLEMFSNILVLSTLMCIVHLWFDFGSCCVSPSRIGKFRVSTQKKVTCCWHYSCFPCVLWLVNSAHHTLLCGPVKFIAVSIHLPNSLVL